MIPQPAYLPGHLLAGGQDHAPVAAASEVLGGIERQARDVAPGSRRLVAIRGSHRLRGVLDHGEAAGAGDGGDGVHGGRLAIEVDGHDGPRPRRHRLVHERGIQVVRSRIDVHEDGPRVHHEHAGRRGHEGEGRGDDLVTGPDADRLEGDDEGIGARSDPDAVGDTAEAGQLALEGGDLGPENEAAGGEHARRRRRQLGLERLVLPREVDLGDHRLPPPLLPRALVPTWPTPRRLTENRNSSSEA